MPRYEITVASPLTVTRWYVEARSVKEAEKRHERGESLTDGSEEQVEESKIVRVRIVRNG